MSRAHFEVVLVKLGGSLITDKRRTATVRRGVLERLCGELAGIPENPRRRLILGHGSGSFGHVAAARYDLQHGALGKEQLDGVAVTQNQAWILNRRVVAAMLASGLKPYSLAPSSFLTAHNGKPRGLALEPLLQALDLGLLPVTFGDIVMDDELGASICSTETVLRSLAARLASRGVTVRTMIWLGETDGIYDADGGTYRRIDRQNITTARASVGGSAGVDVTGGMRHRLDIAWDLAGRGIRSWILDGRDPSVLSRVLRGESVPGTEIRR